MGSELGAFWSTWQKARDTFGEGTPQEGSAFDASSHLDQASSDVSSAAPASSWTGDAASTYDAKNTRHAQILTRFAGLDRQLRTQIDNSANVVATGRQNLDNISQWVTDATANVPDTKAGDQIRMAIAAKGLGEVAGIIQTSNGDLSDIGRQIKGLDEQYRTLGDGFPEAPELGPDGETPEEKDAREQAQQDVEDALNGDQAAAIRVAGVIDGITPGQDLTSTEGSYLSQMQAQMNLRSVENLHEVEEKLGDQGHIIGDSWQLMSNQRVTFPKTESVDGALDDPNNTTTGGFDQLPQSVQQVIKSDGMQYPERLQEIAGIVKDGQPQFQANTDLDKELLLKADRMMDTGIFENDARSAGNDDGLDLGYDAIIGDVFEATSDDHQVVHDHVLGLNGADGDDFLHDINRHAWADDGADASKLFSWTETAYTGHESDLAAQTAEKYGTYLGAHDDEYLKLPGEKTLGELNPALVQGYAHGLSPYVADIAGLSTADSTGPDAFDNPDLGNNDKPIAKGIFSVLSTDPEASKQFNGVAYAHAAAAQAEWAEAVRTHGDVAGLNDKQLDAAIINGLVDVGISNADFAGDVNNDHRAQNLWDKNKAAWDFGQSLVERGVGYVPKVGDYLGEGVEHFGGSLEHLFIGDRPGDNAQYQVIQQWEDGQGSLQVLNSLYANGVPVTGIPQNWLIDTGDGLRLGTPEEILIHNRVQVPETTWQNAVTNALTTTVGSTQIADDVAEKYNVTIEEKNP